jgi:hypothetical protein
MTRDRYQNEINDWFDRRYALVTPEQELLLGDEGVKKMITEELIEWAKQRFETDPEFAQNFWRDEAEQHFEEYLEDNTPQGCYDSKAIIQLGDGELVLMCYARREHLIQWREHETEPANIVYIDAVLREWTPADRYRTLGELEVKG